MPIVTLSNIEKHFGQRVLFDGLNLLIDRGERLGLIGDNGAGKTTLFKVITGQVEPDSGDVAIARSVKVGYLAQDATFDPGQTVMDEAELAFADLHAKAHRLRELEHEMAEHAGEDLDKTLRAYEKLQHEFEDAGGYAWQHRLEATLQGVGLPRESWGQNVETLSGGQRSRLALAKLLISEPDVLLLDEPTNHLDLQAIDWLENYLLQFAGAVLLISHDRYLLDRLATRIVWLTQARLRSYPGNYSAFIQQREVQELAQRRAFEQQQADIEKQKEFIRRFGAGQRAREAKGREKRLNRLLKSDAMIDAVARSRKIHLSIGTEQRAGDQVLQVRDLAKGYDGRTLWDNVKFELQRGERVGIIGPNGSGKTTLLRVLLGEEDADAGRIKWGANLNIGYYDQRLDDFEPDRTILEEVGDGREHIKDKQLRDVLGMLLFRGDDVFKPMGLLSGGERARVALAELLLDGPNVLVLDEPTNHLDINSREALEGALRDFAGTILCVSHDRYFLDHVVRRMLVLQPPNVQDFAGTYHEWAARQAALEQAKAEAPKPAPKPSKPAASPRETAPAATKKDNPYKRRFGLLSVSELEKEIAKTEQELAQCQRQFGEADAFRDPNRGKALHEEYQALTEKLEALESEYFMREG